MKILSAILLSLIKGKRVSFRPEQRIAHFEKIVSSKETTHPGTDESEKIKGCVKNRGVPDLRGVSDASSNANVLASNKRNYYETNSLIRDCLGFSRGDHLRCPTLDR